MDRELSTIAEYLGHTLKSDEDVEFITNMLEDKLENYKKLNDRNNKFISKLKVDPDSLNSHCKDILSSLTKLQEESGVNSLEFSDVGIQILETAEQRFQNKVKLDRLKCREVELLQNIDNVTEETTRIATEFELAKSRIEDFNSASNVEMNSMKILIKSYEDKIAEYINRNPWINEPQYNTLSIQEEIKKLNHLHNEVEKLRSEKEVYKGLEPDLYAAKLQLSKLKMEYEALYKKFDETLK